MPCGVTLQRCAFWCSSERRGHTLSVKLLVERVHTVGRKAEKQPRQPKSRSICPKSCGWILELKKKKPNFFGWNKPAALLYTSNFWAEWRWMQSTSPQRGTDTASSSKSGWCPRDATRGGLDVLPGRFQEVSEFCAENTVIYMKHISG